MQNEQIEAIVRQVVTEYFGGADYDNCKRDLVPIEEAVRGGVLAALSAPSGVPTPASDGGEALVRELRNVFQSYADSHAAKAGIAESDEEVNSRHVKADRNQAYADRITAHLAAQGDKQ